MKYLVAGASTYGVDNMGDDAMLSCLVRAIGEADPANEIVFLARHPDPGFDEIFGLRSIKNLDHDSNDAARGRIFLGFNAGDDRRNLHDIRKELASSDLLIIGGNSLMEISENVFLRGVSSYASTLAMLALFMGKPYALFGLNIVEPIRSKFVAGQAKFLIENATVVTAREEEVLDYLKEAGVAVGNVQITGDPAYGVDLARASRVCSAEILAHDGIVLDSRKRTVSFCLREEYWMANEETIANLEKETCDVMRHVLAYEDTQILFIPNCFYRKGHPLEDDRVINRGIRGCFGENPRVHYIEQRLNLYETLSIFELVDLHVSNRRHSNIFAALYGKPFIPVSTSLKSHISSFVRDLGMSEMLVSNRAFASGVIRSIDRVLADYQTVTATLRGVVSERIASGLTAATRILAIGPHSPP